MSFKGGPSNDYVVGLQAAREGADVYLVDRVKGQWDFTETRRQVVRLHSRYRQTRTILIEEAANGFAIINVLTHQIAGIIPVMPDGWKYARAQAALPIVEAGNVSDRVKSPSRGSLIRQHRGLSTVAGSRRRRRSVGASVVSVA